MEPLNEGVEGVETPLICYKCGEENTLRLPLEPLFNLNDAMFMLPWANGIDRFYVLLNRHKAALSRPIYWRRGRNHVRQRLLSASDLRYLRSVILTHHTRKMEKALKAIEIERQRMDMASRDTQDTPDGWN